MLICDLWLQELTGGRTPAAPSLSRTLMSSLSAAPRPPCSPAALTAAPSPSQWSHVQRNADPRAPWSCAPHRPPEPRRLALPGPPTRPRRRPANCCSSSPTSCWRGARARSRSWPTASRSQRRSSGSHSHFLDCEMRPSTMKYFTGVFLC